MIDKARLLISWLPSSYLSVSIGFALVKVFDETLSNLDLLYQLLVILAML